MNNIFHEPSEQAIQAARSSPNGWVYQIDTSYPSSLKTPPEAILGAWKVNFNGDIIGNFIPNPNYKPIKRESSEYQ
jgi:hypothetical protein